MALGAEGELMEVFSTLLKGSRGETPKAAGAATAPVSLVPSESRQAVRLRTIGVKAVLY